MAGIGTYHYWQTQAIIAANKANQNRHTTNYSSGSNSSSGTYVAVGAGVTRKTTTKKLSGGGRSIENNVSSKVLTGTSYADKITNYALFVTINAGAGNDIIKSERGVLSTGGSVKIDAGAGNDSISVAGTSNTVKGGAGNDTISITSTMGNVALVQYANGDGNDKIYGFSSLESLSISGGSYSTQTSGNDVIVTVGKGKITLVGAKGTTLNIIGKKAATKAATSGGSQKIYSTKSNSTVLTGTTSTATKSTATAVTSSSRGQDILNLYSNKTVTGTSYADTIGNYGDRVKVNAGAGNDSIGCFGDYCSINGGAGNDKIVSSHENRIYGGYGNNTLVGGKGNDSLWGSSEPDTERRRARCYLRL